MRNIHFSRLLDIISGSAIAGANTKIQKSALYKDFNTAKLEGKKLRELIDSNLPTFYIVDCKLLADETIDALLNNSDKYLKENSDYISTIKPNIIASKQELLNAILKVLGNSSISTKPFLPEYAKLDQAYNRLLNKLASKTSYIGYRNAAAIFGSELRSILKTSSVFVASDGAQIVASLPITSRVVIGPTFESTKRKVNEEVNQVISDFVTGLGLSLKKYNKGEGFTIGNLVNAGHTSAVKPSGELIGINMPMAQEKQFLLSGTGKESSLENAIADLYLESNYAITFSQNFVSGATNLLDMQFSFVVSMPREFNTNELRIGEVSRINSFIEGTVLPSIEEQVKAKFFKGIVDELIPNISASPSITDFITSTIMESLKGTRQNTIKLNKKSLVQGKSTIKTPVLKKTELSKSIKISSSNTNGIKIPSIRNIDTGRFISLSSIQGILNANITEQVRKNMGDGNRKDILNYRSGRLADSVHIERMSLSKEGMISAFYTYMKNPYSTFSDGGQQQYPKTRDPKLLISKSIREIAATIAANRMRAILV